MVIVLARIEVMPGRRTEFLREFHRLVSIVRQETGCLEYGPAIDAETTISRQSRLGDHVVMIVEKWATLPDLEAHLRAPHMSEYRERVKDLVRSVELHILQPAWEGLRDQIEIQVARDPCHSVEGENRWA